MNPRIAQPGNQRIACPRCGANNFLGQTQCWQCRASLPPPEALAAPAQAPMRAAPPPAVTPVSAPGAYRAPSAGASPRMLLFVAGALAFLVVWLAALALRGNGGTAAEPTRPLAAVPAAARGHSSENTPLSEERGQARQPAATETDPVMAEARRALERESRNLGVPSNAATDPEGRIRLRSGGAISKDDWEEARRKLQDSPILRTPPNPPPF